MATSGDSDEEYVEGVDDSVEDVEGVDGSEGDVVGDTLVMGAPG